MEITHCLLRQILLQHAYVNCPLNQLQPWGFSGPVERGNTKIIFAVELLLQLTFSCVFQDVSWTCMYDTVTSWFYFSQADSSSTLSFIPRKPLSSIQRFSKVNQSHFRVAIHGRNCWIQAGLWKSSKGNPQELVSTFKS